MRIFPFAAAVTLALSNSAFAQEEAEQETHPSPSAIVEAASADEWVAIPAEDLLVMTLEPNATGKERKIIIQLMPAPFSQGWVSNIRTLARVQWYDGVTVNRVQDNYVVQWGDANGEDPEKAKPLPEGLKVMSEGDYTTKVSWYAGDDPIGHTYFRSPGISHVAGHDPNLGLVSLGQSKRFEGYPAMAGFSSGWPVAGTFTNYYSAKPTSAWPVHCYGMVGVGRDYSPDTGSGAELYTVIGHAPRHLDRNIALVGRIISGMEHLSSMTRGSGPLGFYTDEEAGLRTPIQSIRVASDLAEEDQPAFEYLSTESETFAKYADARANRRDPFFIKPAGGADICNVPVPIRAKSDD